MIELIPVRGLPEIRPGDDLAAMICERSELQAGDVVVVAQKAVSKSRGRLVSLDELEPSEKARELAGDERDPREVEAILREAEEIVRERGPLRDRPHAARIHLRLRRGRPLERPGARRARAPAARSGRERCRPPGRLARPAGVDVGVIVTDSFGRPFRQGTTDVAIGVAGLPAILDLRGTRDRIGYELRASRVAIADEIAAAADLARGKAEGVPVVIVRGLQLSGPPGTAQELVIEPELDLFR